LGLVVPCFQQVILEVQPKEALSKPQKVDPPMPSPAHCMTSTSKPTPRLPQPINLLFSSQLNPPVRELTRKARAFPRASQTLSLPLTRMIPHPFLIQGTLRETISLPKICSPLSWIPSMQCRDRLRLLSVEMLSHGTTVDHKAPRLARSPLVLNRDHATLSPLLLCEVL